MYNHFVRQLSNTKLMDASNEYKEQLDYIDKQHNFIILRTLHGGNYETEMNRSMILENLHHIYESFCLTTGTKASEPYKGRKHIDFTNKKMKSCQDCGDAFSLKNGPAELTCVNCGRIEILDGTAFAMRKTYNVSKPTQKYTFKDTLNKLLDSFYYPTQLFPTQIDEANCIEINRHYHENVSTSAFFYFFYLFIYYFIIIFFFAVYLCIGIYGCPKNSSQLTFCLF